ncbi:RecF/RecN/SMC protein [Neolentinus lepideus HHB14362 ss-1]|uniref:Structural maintenance of chromosomes protein 4 n=1 Tax=Neolentinus lepideus HHB14362 ss-1 TaxID=1314782 RepID=A0A165U1F5_9AGAM|nr:RecF/RecN/SMC protein [Neolentinus lepideus HHB14362 ss-1]
MPPRRSGRTTRSSVEPTPVTTSTTKRKRTQPPAEIPEEEEQENVVAAAPSRSRRETKRSSSKTGNAGRRKPLKEVSEVDEVEQEELPPPKKHRRSATPDAEGSEEEVSAQEEEEEIKPRGRGRGRKASAAPSTAKPEPSKRKPAPKVADASEGEQSAPSRSRRGKTASVKTEVVAEPEARTYSVKGSVRSSRSSKKVKVEEAEDIGPNAYQDISGAHDQSEDEDFEVHPKPRKGRGRAKGTSGKTSNKRGSSATSSAAGPSTAAQEELLDEKIDPAPSAGDEEARAHNVDEGSDEHLVAAQERLVTPPPVKEAEEEKSLLDAPDVAPRSQHTPASQQIKEPEEPQGPRARLVIHKLVLVNFKSYAGRQEIGPFHKSFSAIVGPNGSGKSNTIDALLFVFGWRATKMRQGKLSELIHNSARYPDLDDCSVEVHFREIVDLPGQDAYEVVPDSKLVVSRTAYRNNTSRYTINESQSSFTEVRDLLKGRGIDLDHKRFLILQGEVESIAQMKPKAPSEHEDGLLEYLEDIIGTSKYKEPIEEAMLEMERLSEERQEKLNRLRIVEKEKSALEEKKKEAEDYLRLQNEHVRALSRLWQYYLWQCLSNEERYTDALAKVEQELAHLREQNQDDVTHLDLLQKHYDERQAAYAEVQAAAEEAQKDLAAHEKQAVGLEEKRKHANSKAKKLKKSLHDDENSKKEALRIIEDSARKIAKEKKKTDEFEESLEEEEKVLEEIRDSLKDKTQVFHDQIEVKQKELQPWMAKINTKQAEMDVATSERDALAKKAQAVKEALQDAQETVEKLESEHETKTVELQELKENRAGLQSEVTQGEHNLQQLQSRIQQLRAVASSTRQRVDEAKASHAANTSQNKVLESLTKLKHAGRIEGFHGRLGALGTIPDKYDVAVSTACPSLNNLVVDTVEQGQACIEYLRKQNVGRASFIVLEKLSDNGMGKIATPDNVPRLFDLIKPKDLRFAPAFYKAVGNTLVADTLEHANRIAFGGPRRWRVVTLAGQLIEASGAMSGGGTHVAKGIMSSKLTADAVSPDALRRYEKESDDAAQQLEDVLQGLRKLEADMDNLAKSGPQMDIAIEKVNLDIQTGSKRIVEAQKRVRELKSQSKPDASDIARISSLDKSVAATAEELIKLQENSGVIEQAIKDLEKKILDVGGSRLLTQKSKVDGIKLHIQIASDEITKAEVAKAKAEKDSVKLEGAIEHNTTSLEEAEVELQDLVEQLANVAQYVDELSSKVDAAKAAAENSKDDLDSLKTELDAKTEAIRGFREKEMTLENDLERVKKDLAENDRAIDHWRTEHDKLTLEEIDEDDEEEEEEVDEGDRDSTEPSDPPVKEEPGEGKIKGKARQRETQFELHIYTEAELRRFKQPELIADAELLDEKIKNSKPNLAALKEYQKREEEFLRRAQDLEATTNQRDEMKQRYDSLRKQRLDEFMAGFTAISLKLKEMYQMITLGGNAELELVDNMDPFSEGVIFSVMPPKKSWKNISHLSGGEKTLSSLALVFALHHFKACLTPTPLYFMDEIDAALDFRNVSIVANYIKDRTKNAQFIIISLRNDMFELSHRLIGIYKTANQTQSVSIDNRALTAVPVHTVPSNTSMSVTTH